MPITVDDELTDDRSEVTSEEISEVTDDQEDVADEYQPTIVKADEQTLALHAQCKEFAGRFHSLCDEIETYRSPILTLRKKFGVKQGCSGNVISFPDLGEVLWSQYCDKVFKLTPRRVNQLLDTKDETPANVVKERVPDDEKPLYQKGHRAGYQKAMDDMLAKGVDVKASAPLPEVESKPMFDRSDPYAYWEQFREEPQTMSSELVAMLIELGLDCQTVTQVIELMKKEAKRQTREFAAAA